MVYSQLLGNTLLDCMACRLFSKFHHQKDSWRVGQVRNSWSKEGRAIAIESGNLHGTLAGGIQRTNAPNQPTPLIRCATIREKRNDLEIGGRGIGAIGGHRGSRWTFAGNAAQRYFGAIQCHRRGAGVGLQRRSTGRMTSALDLFIYH